MQIAGLQKLTMLDYPKHTACTVFTQGCNLRCPFCHNASLVLENNEPFMTEDEFFAFLAKRRGILDAVCITGGEPLLQADIKSFISRIKDMGYKVKLDTNGSFPVKLKKLLDANLVDYVAMDVKASFEGYAKATGIADIELYPFMRSIEILRNCDIDYEFRTTLVRGLHTAEDVVAMGSMIRGAKEYNLQAFRDSGMLICRNGLSSYSDKDMIKLAENARPFVKSLNIRGLKEN